MATIVVSWLTVGLIAGIGDDNAAGFMDCWPHCTLAQNATEFVLVASPFAVICILVGRLAAYTRDRMNR